MLARLPANAAIFGWYGHDMIAFVSLDGKTLGIVYLSGAIKSRRRNVSARRLHPVRAWIFKCSSDIFCANLLRERRRFEACYERIFMAHTERIAIEIRRRSFRHSDHRRRDNRGRPGA